MWLKLLRPAWLSDQEWVIAKVGTLYVLAILLLAFSWWKGWLRD